MKLLLALSLTAIGCLAQTPDCLATFQLTGAGTSRVIDNRQVGCTGMTMVYQNTGFSALSIQVEAANGAVVAATFSAATAATGSNPATNTTAGLATFTSVSAGFLRVNLTSATGTGTITGILYGYKNGFSARTNGSSNCITGTANNIPKANGTGGCVPGSGTDTGTSVTFAANVFGIQVGASASNKSFLATGTAGSYIIRNDGFFCAVSSTNAGGGTIDICWGRNAAGITILSATQSTTAATGSLELFSIAPIPVATSSLKTCTATTGIPWRASVNDATAPALGIVLTGGGTVYATVHCSLTTGTYLVDGL